MLVKFRKKPVVVDAIQWTGTNGHEVIDWATSVGHFPHGVVAAGWSFDYSVGKTPKMTIPTLEGDHVANPGDWIIRGVAGEFYPCKPDIFEKTYEEVGSAEKATTLMLTTGWSCICPMCEHHTSARLVGK